MAPNPNAPRRAIAAGAAGRTAVALWIALSAGLSAGLSAAGAAESGALETGALLEIRGGRFLAGDPEGEADETPRQAEVGSFRLMRLEVTTRQFERFVAASGHVTDPELSGSGYVWDSRWRLAPGASWRFPEGPAEPPAGPEHPVVQVSARDAAAFCAFHGLRLPSDSEWEYAARGSDGRRFPWGDGEPGEADRDLANFGTLRCCAPDAGDGYLRRAPVGSYPRGRSPFGILDMAGNVWEWTASTRPDRPERVILRGGGWGNNPYCLRTSYRHDNPPDIGLSMVGFRCAADGD